MSNTTVYFHGGCADGFTAAWVAWTQYGQLAEYVPYRHGDEMKVPDGHWVYCLDFCPPAAVMERLVRNNRSVVVIDHHQTAVPVLELASKTWGNFVSYFDLERSGARLAWDWFVNPNTPRPWLVDLVQDRDLWRFEEPFSRELNAWVAVHPHTFETWSLLARTLKRPSAEEVREVESGGGLIGLSCRATADAVGRGAAVLAYQKTVVERAVRSARLIHLAGHEILAANTATLQSEVAGELAKGRPFGACWYARDDGKVSWSLRSDQDGLDVSVVAKRYGGGGHKHAAGFEVPIHGLPLPPGA